MACAASGRASQGSAATLRQASKRGRAKSVVRCDGGGGGVGGVGVGVGVVASSSS